MKRLLEYQMSLFRSPTSIGENASASTFASKFESAMALKWWWVPLLSEPTILAIDGNLSVFNENSVSKTNKRGPNIAATRESFMNQVSLLTRRSKPFSVFGGSLKD